MKTSRIFVIVIIAFLFGAAAGYFGKEIFEDQLQVSTQPSAGKKETSTANPSKPESLPEVVQETLTDSVLDSLEVTDSTENAFPFEEIEEAEEAGEDYTYEGEITPEEDETELASQNPENYEEETVDFQSDENEEGIVIKKEQLLKTVVMDNYFPKALNKTDSVDAILEKHLSIHPELPEEIVVEFWKSPVNFKGYKFNRKKLVLYGVLPEKEIHLSNYLRTQYMIMDAKVFKIQETGTYAPYMEERNVELKNHLLKHAD